MRIALIDPSLFTLPYDRALATGLSESGHEIVLHGRKLRPDDGPVGDVNLAQTFYRVADSRAISRLPAKLRLGVKGLDHARSMWRLLGRLQRDKPDVIHFQWLPLPLVDRALLGLFRKVAPLVLTVHDTNPFNGDPSAAVQASGFRQCLDQFDTLVVHTAQGEERLRRMGVPARRLKVLPHGLLVDPVPTVADPMTGTLTFVLFGKIKPYKGADLLIQAYAALPEALRGQARLRIVGKPYMDLTPLLAEAAPFGASIAVEAGHVGDDAIDGLFGPGTVAVFPYREIEASGVLFLAVAHGRPIIASRLGSFAELLADGQHGHLVPACDVTALTEAMAHMIADRGFAAATAASVRALADDVPSWREIAGRTVATYRAAQSRAAGLTVLEVARSDVSAEPEAGPPKSATTR